MIFLITRERFIEEHEVNYKRYSKGIINWYITPKGILNIYYDIDGVTYLYSAKYNKNDTIINLKLGVRTQVLGIQEEEKKVEEEEESFPLGYDITDDKLEEHE